MFERRKEEIGLMRKAVESIESTQKTTEHLIDSISFLIEQDKVVQEEARYTDEEKRRVAYALNLCSVSVSQIIDYDDENILEQEYETILNNLNLENMPKDDALLNTLKQLLDTVTFFRIQEGDKVFIEKEYQQKVKNAIWNAVPNFGLIVAGGNPYTIAISLASQVGIGYMNYRKSKAENILEKEQKEWQLQRAAIEQLNGLRRELFDASWRLADKYKFQDEYRLTEKQITQYNKILMDTDEVRKYERLESVMENFIAYPPFWYYFGNAANSIAVNALKNEEEDIYLYYKERAIQHFDKYMQINKYKLLREDQITSSCALEYIDLLDPLSNRDKIMELLDIAIKSSGRECDILQLCAISYLKIDEKTSAVELLKYLVNESYNEIINAQLLSSIYVSGYMESNIKDFLIDYKMLQKKVNSELLFPLPEDSNMNIDELKDNFVLKQRDLLFKKYSYVLRNYYEKCTIMFNKSIPVPYEDKYYPDSFFSDQYEYREERFNKYKELFSNRNKVHDFITRLAYSNFDLGYLEILNKMVNDIESIIVDETEDKSDIVGKLSRNIESKIIEQRYKINHLKDKMNIQFGIEEFKLLFDLSLDVFTKEFYKMLINEVKNHIVQLKSMSDFSKEETILREFCIKQEIPEFKTFLSLSDEKYTDSSNNEIYFSSELLGKEARKRSEMLNKARKMSKRIDTASKSIIEIDDKKKSNVHIYTRWNKLSKISLKEYFNNGKKKYYTTNKDIREKTIAVLVDKSLGLGNTDLVFTVDGIIIDKMLVGLLDKPTITSYKNITYENDTLIIGNQKYKHKEVNTIPLFDLIQELAEIMPK